MSNLDYLFFLDFDDSRSRNPYSSMSRNANRSSCTNKNESGNYFLSSKRYNLHTATPTMYNKASVAGSETELLQQDGSEQAAVPILNGDSAGEEQQQQQQKQQEQEQLERLKKQRINAQSQLSTNNRAHTVLSMYEKNRNSQMSIRAPSSFGTVESVHTANAHTTNWRKHAMEAGINLNVPGNSEHQYRYTSPVKANYKNFVLNPQQDTRLMKRPFLLADYDQITSEYRQRFMFPNKNQIDKFPWIKQLN